MDPASFDRLSRVVATTPSRRTALGAIVGALAGLLGRVGAPADTAAQPRLCRRLGKACLPTRGLDCCHGVCRTGRCRCPASRRACRGACIPKHHCCRSGECGGGQVCHNGRCQCPAGKKRCGEHCIARAACCQDRECRPRGRCVGGHCRCAAGFRPCRGDCIPAADCCGSGDCGEREACVGGRCQCRPGFKPCQGGCIAQATCCGGCGADQNCVNGTCEAKLCGAGGPCRVFLTSQQFEGDLRENEQGSGLAGADAKCQALAQTAGLPGTYKAWLSDQVSSPSTRFTNTANTGPYVLPDAAATVIAADWAELTSGFLRAPINVTEEGVSLGTSGGFVWTHTLANGTPGGPGDVECVGWTRTLDPGPSPIFFSGDNGFSSVTISTWTASSTIGCLAGLRLYCFEQG